MKFSAGSKCPIPLDDIVRILTRYGCRISKPHEGKIEVTLPHDENYRSSIGETGTLSIEGNSVFEFDLERPQSTPECRGLLFALIDELGFTMFPDYGQVMYARKDVFQNVPKPILDQFSERVVVRNPDHCSF